jgi:hypothetical protein
MCPGPENAPTIADLGWRVLVENPFSYQTAGPLIISVRLLLWGLVQNNPVCNMATRMASGVRGPGPEEYPIYINYIHVQLKRNRELLTKVYASEPPSAAHTAPVTYVLSGPNKKEITLAISWGSPSRANGR